MEVLEPCAGTRNWFQRESYPLFVEVLERRYRFGTASFRESYPLFVEVLELGDSGGRGEFCESYLLFVVVLELS